MCKCTPNIRTPFCGKLGCEWPESKPEGARGDDSRTGEPKRYVQKHTGIHVANGTVLILESEHLAYRSRAEEREREKDARIAVLEARLIDEGDCPVCLGFDEACGKSECPQRERKLRGSVNILRMQLESTQAERTVLLLRVEAAEKALPTSHEINLAAQDGADGEIYSYRSGFRNGANWLYDRVSAALATANAKGDER